jgi:capsular exopolysaccharide synthesis family protein
MVTSAIPDDGKTFVAANLAISIARGVEEHVLLVDCDMRRPSIHSRFGYKDDCPGLSSYLSHNHSLDTLLRRTAVDKLTILPGGPQPPNPSELLSSEAMKDLLIETSNRYNDRYVIVDSPPPQLTAETTALANYIDGIIVVVKYGVTPKDRIKNLLEKIGREKVIGVVMNSYRIPAMERYGYGQYKKYKKD